MTESPDPDVPPWEEPGAVRRDCLPHRGGILNFLGTVAMVAGAISICCVPLALIGLSLGIVVWRLAQRDLIDMEAGKMDPDGVSSTAIAVTSGQVAAISPR